MQFSSDVLCPLLHVINLIRVRWPRCLAAVIIDLTKAFMTAASDNILQLPKKYFIVYFIATFASVANCPKILRPAAEIHSRTRLRLPGQI